MKVINELNIIDDELYPLNNNRILRIKSHWNRKNLVVLQVNDEKEFTIDANGLLLAIRNAMNFK